MRRREVFLAAGVERLQRGSEQPAVSAPRVRTPISPTLEPRDASLAPAASPPAAAIKVKREVQEISLLDSDDDVVVLCAPVSAKQKQARRNCAASAAQTDKRAASASTIPEAAAETSPKRRKTLPVAAAAKSASPPRQETVSLRDQLKKLSSKPRPPPSVPPSKPVVPPAVSDECMPFALPLPTAATRPLAPAKAPAPTTPPPPAEPAGPRTAPHAPTHVALARSPVQMTSQPPVPSRVAVCEVSVDPRKRPGTAAAASPSQAASAPVARPPVAPAPTPPSRIPPAPSKEPSLDFLYRPSQAPAPDAIPAAVLPLPVFVANPITLPAHNAVPLCALTVRGSPLKHDFDQDFWFQPPRPFPTFSPLPSDFPHSASDIIPVELATQLYTVCVRDLISSVTQRLLLAFITRNQHQLRPRVLAFRTRPHESRAIPESVFYLAFRSEQDALLTIGGSNGRQLSHFEACRTLEMELVRDTTRQSATAAQTPIKPASIGDDEEAARKAKVGLEQELALEWTWGELSDEVRQEWLTRKSLPPYRVCPQYEFEADPDNDLLINDEYEDEATHILKLENRKDRLRRKANRPRIEREKLELYKERCKDWSAWRDRPKAEREQALQHGEIAWPMWPDDAAVEIDQL